MLINKKLSYSKWLNKKINKRYQQYGRYHYIFRSTGNQQNMKLALDPVQSDFLAMNIKTSDEKPYNIHELPSIDGK